METQITKILNENSIERPKCICCGNDIVYKDTKVGFDKNGKIKITGKSYLSRKNVCGNIYNLCVCEDCFRKKFEKTHFNVMCDGTKYAFNIPDDVYLKTRKNYAMTKNCMIRKYGEEEGQKRWENYCKRQSETNTFEYKHKKYGWSQKQFDAYNKSRAVTLKNLIRKYGEEDGQKRWEKYVEQQHTTKSFEYMCEVYGEKKAIAINKSKAITLENFVRKHGEKIGTEKWIEFCKKRSNLYSEISQKLFDKIDKYLGKKYTTYYATKNNEKCILLSKTYMLDYYIQELRICIEFNDTYFHADPRVFSDDDHCSPFNKNITAKEIRAKDEKRYKELFEKCGIKTFVIWEFDYNEENFDVENYIKNTLKIEI